MPITTSAKKALRVAARKRVFNVRTKAAIDTPMKKFRKLISEKKGKEAIALVPSLYQALDKAVKRDFIKAGAADRQKSRIMAAIKRTDVK